MDHEVKLILERLDAKVDHALALLLASSAGREWFDTREFAALCGVTDETVREWCRDGRIEAKKLPNGGWRIHRGELDRLKKDGLLPAPSRPPQSE
jgi:excisionase family DNA binding protein